jgi:hypothetical protein
MTDAINPDLETVKKALKANQFIHVECVENGARAAALVLDMIPQAAQVGLGGSTSVRQLGIAPQHAAAYGAKLPCAITGYCVDCDSPARICRVTTIIEKKPSATDVSILLVDEDLGLGWDPAWPEERKARIASMYRDTRKKYYPAGRKLPSEKPAKDL